MKLILTPVIFKFECVYINMSVTLGCISLCFILTLFVIITDKDSGQVILWASWCLQVFLWSDLTLRFFVAHATR